MNPVIKEFLPAATQALERIQQQWTVDTQYDTLNTEYNKAELVFNQTNIGRELHSVIAFKTPSTHDQISNYYIDKYQYNNEHNIELDHILQPMVLDTILHIIHTCAQLDNGTYKGPMILDIVDMLDTIVFDTTKLDGIVNNIYKT